MSPLQKVLIGAGVALVALGLAWPWIDRLGLGRLPGDIRLEREGFTLFAPVTTMLLLSAALTIILRLLNR